MHARPKCYSQSRSCGAGFGAGCAASAIHTRQQIQVGEICNGVFEGITCIIGNSNMKKEHLKESNTKPPWHLFLVGLFFFLIYLVGAYDYIMIQSNNLDYMNSLNVKGDLVEYFTNYPFLYTFLWTINVFGGLIAVIMLLFRTKWVVWLSLTVVVSKMSLDVLTFLFRNRWEVFGPQIALTDLTVLLITVAFYLYCRALSKRRILS